MSNYNACLDLGFVMHVQIFTCNMMKSSTASHFLKLYEGIVSFFLYYVINPQNYVTVAVQVMCLYAMLNEGMVLEP